MSWASDFPEELLTKPTGLIVLSGLDLTYSAVHKAIWDGFCNNRKPDRLPMRFKVLDADYEYPKCKQKKTSYDWYVPKGILKRNWMRKHLEQVPAVVVLFFDLDWDESAWKERVLECKSKIDIVRSALFGRATRLAVVLVQHRVPLPGEDSLAQERASAFCATCEVSVKSLFIFPQTDHLLGYIVRLENAFYELSQQYYAQEVKKVKQHRDFLNKTTHQLLFVRHNYKIGFCYELQQDSQNAVKYYRKAYASIQETRMHDMHILEVKVAAGYVNYKLCRLLFTLSTPLEAIHQFRRHVDFFKNRVGMVDLGFEHACWMAKQFETFGDLFQDAIKSGGLVAIQTQHPGFYYQQAVAYTMQRRALARQLCRPSPAQLAVDPAERQRTLESLNEQLRTGCGDFYAQRFWRANSQSIDQTEPAKERERDGITQLQALESTIDYSAIVIPLLSTALSEFKKYRSPRMQHYLAVQIADEHLLARKCAQALQIQLSVARAYRDEAWFSLLAAVLSTALRSAFLVAALREYCAVALELISPQLTANVDERARVQTNLLGLFVHRRVPESELGCDAVSVSEALANWRAVRAVETTSEAIDRPLLDCGVAADSLIAVRANTLRTFVECRAVFLSSSFQCDSPIRVAVFLRACCPLPIRFARLALTFSNSSYNSTCTLSADGDSRALHFEPNQLRAYEFSFYSQLADINKSLEVTSVNLLLGVSSTPVAGDSSALNCAPMLQLFWTLGAGDRVPQSPSFLAATNKLLERVFKVRNGVRQLSAQTSIRPKLALVDLQVRHDPPCLESEFYPVELVISNGGAKKGEDSCIVQPSLDLGVKEANDATELLTHVSVDTAEFDGKVVSKRNAIALEDIEVGTAYSKRFFVRCENVEKVNLNNIEAAADARVPRVLSYRLAYRTRARVHCVPNYTVMPLEAPAERLETEAKSADTIEIDTLATLEGTIEFSVVRPFSFTMQLQVNDTFTAHVDENFLLITDVHVASPHELFIERTDMQFADFLLKTEDVLTDEAFSSTTGERHGLKLKHGEALTEIASLKPIETCENAQCIGMYYVRWRRAHGENSPSVPIAVAKTSLPAIRVRELPVRVTLEIPSFGVVRQPFSAVYTVYNSSSIVQELEVSIESTDGFMFSGNRVYHVRVAPQTSQQLCYNYYPLLIGEIEMPRLNLTLTRSKLNLTDYLRRALSTHIFIKPAGKEFERQFVTATV